MRSENIKEFLLKTSLLNRLDPSLCDAVIGRPGSQAILEKFAKFLECISKRRILLTTNANNLGILSLAIEYTFSPVGQIPDPSHLLTQFPLYARVLAIGTLLAK